MLKQIVEKVKMGDYSSDESYFADAIRQGLKGVQNIETVKSKNPGDAHLVIGRFIYHTEDGKKKIADFTIDCEKLLDLDQ